ncbi:MAG TPA: hypothetical protein VGN17_06145 [Bryobacteraceae bacterium]|jgi:hypothetical protein
MGSINNISSTLQAALCTALQSAGLTSKTSGASPTQPQDNGQLSPLARVLSTLQQLQQSDPAKYQQVTAQIATNLQDAAQTAQANGNTTAANQLNQLSADFSNASKTGQLPNIQDLAQAVGGHHHGHHHGHHAHAADGDGDSGATSSSGGAAAASSPTASNSTASSSAAGTDPLAIILNTLSSAGLTNSNG